MSFAHTLNRRMLLQATTLGLGSLALPRLTTLAQTPTSVDEITIDLSSEPASLAPSQVYEVNGWSVVHSIFDAPFEYDSNGQMIMVAAESLDPGRRHDVRDQAALRDHLPRRNAADRAIARRQLPADRQPGHRQLDRRQLFDDHRRRRGRRSDGPDLAQRAIAMAAGPDRRLDALPPAERGRGNRYVQSAGWDRSVLLRRVEARRVDHACGQPELQQPGQGQADRETGRLPLRDRGRHPRRRSPVRHRPDRARGAAGSNQAGRGFRRAGHAGAALLRRIRPDRHRRQAVRRCPRSPGDQLRGRYRCDPEGVCWRIPDSGCRTSSCRAGWGSTSRLRRIHTIPDKAKSLLSEAGVSGLSTTIAATNSERKDLVEAIAGYLSDAGIKTTVEVQEVATFNGQWTDPSAPPLRYATWRPMFDPFNLLNLVFSENGFLSRHKNPDIQTLIDQAAVATDPGNSGGAVSTARQGHV